MVSTHALPFLIFLVPHLIQASYEVENRDSTCADSSYAECSESEAQTAMHTKNLESCIEQCELFNSFGNCDYLLFHTSGQHENCHLILEIWCWRTTWRHAITLVSPSSTPTMTA